MPGRLQGGLHCIGAGIGVAFAIGQLKGTFPTAARLERAVGIPVAGSITYPGVPFRPSVSTPAPRRPAPTLGQHNEEVLSGLLGRTLADLEQAGALS